MVNDVFAERCADLNLRSNAGYTSYVEDAQNEESDVSNDSEEEGGNTALSAFGPTTPDEPSADKAKLLVKT